MERLEHVIILRGAFAFIIDNSISISSPPFPPFPASILFYLLSISPITSLLPSSFQYQSHYIDTPIPIYPHIHISIHIHTYLFQFPYFSNFPSSFYPYLPCISCIIKLYKICITEYFPYEYKHTAYHKNRLKRLLGAENGYIPIYGQFKYICLCIVDNIDIGKMYKTIIYILCKIPYCNRLRDMLFCIQKVAVPLTEVQEIPT